MLSAGDLLHIIILDLYVVQEYSQRSSEWEQQRVQYQKQVASLEAQRKSLAEQFTQMKVMDNEMVSLYTHE